MHLFCFRSFLSLRSLVYLLSFMKLPPPSPQGNFKFRGNNYVASIFYNYASEWLQCYICFYFLELAWYTEPFAYQLHFTSQVNRLGSYWHMLRWRKKYTCWDNFLVSSKQAHSYNCYFHLMMGWSTFSTLWIVGTENTKIDISNDRVI